MQPQVWFDTECINFSSTSDPCFGSAKVFNLRGMSFEGTVKDNVAKAVGVAAAELFDICLEGCAPKTTLDCNLARVIPNPPTGSEVLKSANFTITPTKDEIGEKTLISPLRVSVYFKKSDFKDSNAKLKKAKEDITAALNKLPAVGQGPVDAFFSVMTLGKQLDKNDASTWKNLVEIASSAGTAQGIKNFFHLWPSQDKTYSVKAAWAADKELELAFYVVFVDGVPSDGNYVKAQDGYFVIFDGTADHKISDPLALMTPWSAEPTPTPGTEFVTFEGFTNDEWTVVTLSDDEQDAAKAKLPDGFLVGSQTYANTVNGAIDSSDVDMIVTADAETAAVVKNVSGDWVLQTETTASDFSLAAQKTFAFADGGEYDQDGAVDGSITLSAFVCTQATPTSTPTPGGGGSSGGCNAGFAPLALLLLAPLAVLLKK
jgi:Synergist-CTERM protein sorting domain-containing protein